MRGPCLPRFQIKRPLHADKVESLAADRTLRLYYSPRSLARTMFLWAPSPPDQIGISAVIARLKLMARAMASGDLQGAARQ